MTPFLTTEGAGNIHFCAKKFAVYTPGVINSPHIHASVPINLGKNGLRLFLALYRILTPVCPPVSKKWNNCHINPPMPENWPGTTLPWNCKMALKMNPEIVIDTPKVRPEKARTNKGGPYQGPLH